MKPGIHNNYNDNNKVLPLHQRITRGGSLLSRANSKNKGKNKNYSKNYNLRQLSAIFCVSPFLPPRPQSKSSTTATRFRLHQLCQGFFIHFYQSGEYEIGFLGFMAGRLQGRCWYILPLVLPSNGIGGRMRGASV